MSDDYKQLEELGKLGNWSVLLNSENLKPCPFCGYSAEIKTGIHGEVYVECSNRNCRASFGSDLWVTSKYKNSLIEKWNTRV